MEHYAHLTDEELVAEYLGGDSQAFTSIVNRFMKPVYNFVYRLCGNEKDAEEIVQESFVKLWKNIKKFRRGEKFKTWFYTIARNTAIDYLRKKKHIVFSAFDNEDGGNVLEDTLVSEEPGAIELFESSENKIFLEGLLEGLPTHYREVLFLYYNEDLNLEEISQVLNKPLNTVKSQHRRALMHLRNKVDTAPNSNKRT
jgi:RNA polymerase sigma-70 factor (ECF subfamily)